MANKELVITLRFAAEAAEQMEKAHFDRTRKRVADLADAQVDAEKRVSQARKEGLKDFYTEEQVAEAALKRQAAITKQAIVQRVAERRKGLKEETRLAEAELKEQYGKAKQMAEVYQDGLVARHKKAAKERGEAEIEALDETLRKSRNLTTDFGKAQRSALRDRLRAESAESLKAVTDRFKAENTAAYDAYRKDLENFRETAAKKSQEHIREYTEALKKSAELRGQAEIRENEATRILDEKGVRDYLAAKEKELKAFKQVATQEEQATRAWHAAEYKAEQASLAAKQSIAKDFVKAQQQADKEVEAAFAEMQAANEAELRRELQVELGLIKANNEDIQRLQEQTAAATRAWHAAQHKAEQARLAAQKSIAADLAAAERRADREVEQAFAETRREMTATLRQEVSQELGIIQAGVADEERVREQAAERQREMWAAQHRMEQSRLAARNSIAADFARDDARANRELEAAFAHVQANMTRIERLELAARLQAQREHVRDTVAQDHTIHEQRTNAAGSNAGMQRLQELQQLSMQRLEIVDREVQATNAAMAQVAEARSRGDRAGVQAAAQTARERSRLAKRAADDIKRFAAEAMAAERAAGRGQNQEIQAQAEVRRRVIRGIADESIRAAADSARAVTDGVRTENAARNEQMRSILNVSQSYTIMRGASLIYQEIQTTWRAIGQSSKDAADHIKANVEQMEHMRDAMREILAMQGKPLTAMSTAEEAREAAAAHVKTDQYVKIKGSVQAYSQGESVPAKDAKELEELSNLDEKDLTAQQKARKGELQKDSQNYRLKPGMMNRIIQFAAPLAVSQGIDEESMGRLVGTAVRTAKKGKTAEEDEENILDQLSKDVFSMQMASGHTSKLTPQFAEVAEEISKSGGTGEDVLDAADIFRVMAEKSPEHAKTYARQLKRGTTQLRGNEEKMDRFGLDQKMTDEEIWKKIRVMVPQIAKDENKSEDAVLMEAYNELREFEGFKTFMEEGYDKGKMARFKKERQGAGVGKTREAIKEYQAGQEGMSNKAAAEDDAATYEQAAKDVNITQIRKEVRTHIKQSGVMRHKETILGATATEKYKKLTGLDREEQLVATNTGIRLRQELEPYKHDDEVAAFLAKYPVSLVDSLGFDPLGLSVDGVNLDAQSEAANLIAKKRTEGKKRSARGESQVKPGAVMLQREARRQAFEQGKAANPGSTKKSFEQWEHTADAEAMNHLDKRANMILAGIAPDVPLPERGTVNTVPLQKGYPDRPENSSEYGASVARRINAAQGGDKAMKELKDGAPVPGGGAKPEATMTEDALREKARKLVYDRYKGQMPEYKSYEDFRKRASADELDQMEDGANTRMLATMPKTSQPRRGKVIPDTWMGVRWTSPRDQTNAEYGKDVAKAATATHKTPDKAAQALESAAAKLDRVLTPRVSAAMPSKPRVATR